jgi:hypothetical protein
VRSLDCFGEGGKRDSKCGDAPDEGFGGVFKKGFEESAQDCHASALHDFVAIAHGAVCKSRRQIRVNVGGNASDSDERDLKITQSFAQFALRYSSESGFRCDLTHHGLCHFDPSSNRSLSVCSTADGLVEFGIREKPL